MHLSEERENRVRREMVTATYAQLKQLRAEMAASHSARLKELAQLIVLRDKQLEAALYGAWSSAGAAAWPKPKPKPRPSVTL